MKNSTRGVQKTALWGCFFILTGGPGGIWSSLRLGLRGVAHRAAIQGSPLTPVQIPHL